MQELEFCVQMECRNASKFLRSSGFSKVNVFSLFWFVRVIGVTTFNHGDVLQQELH